MTVGDLIDRIENIEELEAQIEILKANWGDYLDPERKLKELENLIAIYKSEVIE